MTYYRKNDTARCAPGFTLPRIVIWVSTLIIRIGHGMTFYRTAISACRAIEILGTWCGPSHSTKVHGYNIRELEKGAGDVGVSCSPSILLALKPGLLFNVLLTSSKARSESWLLIFCQGYENRMLSNKESSTCSPPYHRYNDGNWTRLFNLQSEDLNRRICSCLLKTHAVY